MICIYDTSKKANVHQHECQLLLYSIRHFQVGYMNYLKTNILMRRLKRASQSRNAIQIFYSVPLQIANTSNTCLTIRIIPTVKFRFKTTETKFTQQNKESNNTQTFWLKYIHRSLHIHTYSYTTDYIFIGYSTKGYTFFHRKGFVVNLWSIKRLIAWKSSNSIKKTLGLYLCKFRTHIKFSTKRRYVIMSIHGG